ncbi:hypothetical protein Pfo_002653 [Paulownia fortunei]|nr:hypothetical protein Pfo_002653 [Paulownia fortunei]
MKVFEVSGTTLSLAVFVDVTNSKKLRDLMQAGTLETEVALLNDSLVSATVHIVSTSSLSYCCFSLLYNILLFHQMLFIKGLIKGTEVGLEELEGRADQALIQKHYKLLASELGTSSVSDAKTCRIAARDAL